MGLPFKVLFTGQHQDIGKFYYDYNINIVDGHNRLDSIIQSTMNLYVWDDITHVLVQGDTTSVLSVALAAFNRKIKVIHLEAGLRTYDNENPYPEEQNRRMVSQITDIHLCPTDLSRENLVNERILGEKYVVGNTVLDNLLSYKDKCEYNNIVLITMHRRENHKLLEEWFEEIEKLATEHPSLDFIIPLHPNPNVQKHRNIFKKVNVIEPLSHENLLDLLVKTKMVITDSGGIQEECSFFNKKCLTCRKTTERPEAMGQSTFIVKTPKDLNDIFYKELINYEINHYCPFGDGKSAERIYNILKNYEL